MINKAAFAKIVDGLNLKLSPAMQKNYIDVNWRFVDRALQGRISFGQFLSCYANFLYSYEISQVMITRCSTMMQTLWTDAAVSPKSPLEMQGMRKQRLKV